jgi:hypothetical protein
MNEALGFMRRGPTAGYPNCRNSTGRVFGVVECGLSFGVDRDGSHDPDLVDGTSGSSGLFSCAVAGVTVNGASRLARVGVNLRVIPEV